MFEMLLSFHFLQVIKLIQNSMQHILPILLVFHLFLAILFDSEPLNMSWIFH